MKVSQLKPNPDNPRVIKDESFEKLCNSIKEFPKMMALRPIVVDGNNMVLGGNMRLKALQHLGFKEIPDTWVRKASELTDEEKRRFIIADNVSSGEWDWGVLQADWDLGELDEWGLEIPDYEVKQPEAVEDEYQIPDEIKTDIVLGDLFEIGQHRLLCGDSTCSDTVAKLMNGEKADMVFTDPPYGIDYKHDNRPAKRPHKFDVLQNDNIDLSGLLPDAFKNMNIFTKDEGVYYCWHSGKTQREFQNFLEESGFLISTTIIWSKGHFAFSRQDYHPQHEPCFYGWKKGKAHNFYGARNQSTIWEVLYDSGNKTAGHNTMHPTQKPIKLAEIAIKNSSKENDLILDLFLGSGSTMVAAHQLNRKCYGMELDVKYVDIIVQRMIKLDNTLTIKRNGVDETKKWLDKLV